MTERCKYRMYRRWVVDTCMKNAVRDGYCNQHHPDAVAARRKAADDRFAEQRAAEAAVYERKRIRDRKAALFGELVAALELAKLYLDEGETRGEVRTVLAKAKEIAP